MDANTETMTLAAMTRTLSPARRIKSGGVMTLAVGLPMTEANLRALEALWRFELASQDNTDQR